MKTNPLWATDEFAREVAKRKIWSRRSWTNRKVHAFLRLAQPSDLSARIWSDDNLREEVAAGRKMISACYPKILNRVADWSHSRYFLDVETANSETATFRLQTTSAHNPWEIEEMCLTCRRVIATGEGVGFGVCSDYD